MDFTPLKENPASLRFLWGLLQLGPYLAFVGIPLLLCNVVQFVGLIVLYPFSRHAYRAYNYWIATFWWTLLVRWTRHIHRMRIVRSGDEIPRGKSAIVICNHVEQPDVPVALDFASTAGSLGGVKFFVKEPLKWVPGLGWGMQMLNYLFVKRAWSEDGDFVERMFRRLREYRSPVWILSYPEGTRIKPHKLERSRDFARRRGFPVLDNVLLPRPKGFVVTVERMRDRVDGVYDLTIGYPQGIPTLGQFIRGAIPEVHLHVRRHPIASLPTGADALAGWLMARFQEKDARIRDFLRDRKFR